MGISEEKISEGGVVRDRALQLSGGSSRVWDGKDRLRRSTLDVVGSAACGMAIIRGM